MVALTSSQPKVHCRFGAVTIVWNVVFDDFRLFDVRLIASKCFLRRRRQQTGSSLPNWPRVCPTAKFKCRATLKIVAIYRENTSATPRTIVENYFRFASTAVENGLNGLG